MAEEGSTRVNPGRVRGVQQARNEKKAVARFMRGRDGSEVGGDVDTLLGAPAAIGGLVTGGGFHAHAIFPGFVR